MLQVLNSHFGLTERPFALVPDAGFFYGSKGHLQALAAVEYGVLGHMPITLLTGELGAGKTTLMHYLTAMLPREIMPLLIFNATGGPEEVLRWIMGALGQPAAPDETHVATAGRFRKFLTSMHASGRRVLLIVDEAQHMAPETLEVLRLLTNVNAGKNELIQLLLIGQPELLERVALPSLAAFAQRVGAHCHLGALSFEDTAGYINHRLTSAGAQFEIFTPKAIAAVHALSGGIPRLINQLCDLALVYAYSENRHTVDADLIEAIRKEECCFFLAAARATEMAQAA